MEVNGAFVFLRRKKVIQALDDRMFANLNTDTREYPYPVFVLFFEDRPMRGGAFECPRRAF